ncbi:M56 family metallopeptidase [Flavobacterium sp. MFBS3-15]|uniref:M56 family metallopeptidase n=1 Tax=Flavobacterium sp. MFBS3-15 TaxID=2989816 RepID=UPI002236397B|nr:M56 family metallopeptidase [Flavobacterium sp. MFBS3-15]MCW4467723.1 M56 family metallopeptidase [Flavobacterium sp. MFBS3-15]
MENFIIYMAKACGLIALFFIAYHALLKKETFFNSNRWFLLAGLFTAAAMPLLVYTKTIWVDPAPFAETASRTVTLEQLMLYKQYQEQLTAGAISQPETITINWFDVLGGIYLAGVALFAIRFVLDFLAIRRILGGNIVVKDGRFRLIDSEKAQSPFSFFNYIVFNSAQLKQEELEGIIIHEKVHSSQKHSLDMIISQLFCIAFWFNPLMWMYKKSISQNLEFIADAGAIKLMEDKQAYQKTLLKITVQPDCINLTNHFYQSLIKKRIVMLNKKRSKSLNSWKYATMLPLLAAFMLVFQVKTVAQEKQSVKQAVKLADTQVKFAIEINKDTQDDELEQSKQLIKDEYNADVNYENVTRNLDKEITGIKVTVKDKGQSQVYEVAGHQPIAPFTIEIEKGNSGRNTITFGNSLGQGNFVRAQAFRIDSDGDFEDFKKDSTRVQKHKIIKSYGMNSDMMPQMPQMPASPEGHWSVNSLKIGDTDMLIVINGVKQKKGNPIKLPLGQEIAELNMLKGKEAKKKYGKEGKEGAVEIITKATGPFQMKIGPEMHSFVMPEGSMDFNFDMPMDFDIRIEDFPNMQQFMGIIKDGDFQFSGTFDSETIEQLRKHAEDMKAQGFEKFRNKEMAEEDQKAAKEELEKAKKEIEESRKELEQSRKELEKARKQLNKKA